jgi:hypothetical protein
MTEPIQIKRAEVTAQIRELAALMDVSLTDAVQKAVSVQLAAERARASLERTKRRASADQILDRIRSYPVIGPALTDEDLYDAEGLPK